MAYPGIELLSDCGDLTVSESSNVSMSSLETSCIVFVVIRRLSGGFFEWM